MEQTFDFATGDSVLRIVRDYAEVNMSSRVADESWRFTDSNGHEHAYSDSPREPVDHYPTLVYVPGPSYDCAGCHGEHEDFALSRYECRICGEKVEPGSREPRNPEVMALTRVSPYLSGTVGAWSARS